MTESGERHSWIETARKGDQAAASALLATYHSVLRSRTVERMGPVLGAKLEAEDILQQVYLEVLRKIDCFEGQDPQTFLNWTLTIVDHKLADARRALQRLKRDVARERSPQAVSAEESCMNLLDELYAESYTASHTVRREEAVGAVLASISRLPQVHRQVIRLRFLEGQSVAYVAGQLGRSEAAVKMLTQRALGELRKLMDGLGEFTRIP
jgi:RNA polymerase sigma-70 factor (ECF subfamily)